MLYFGKNLKNNVIFNVIWNFYKHLISIYGQNSQTDQWEMDVFSAQINLDGNLWRKYVAKVCFVGITILPEEIGELKNAKKNPWKSNGA